MGASIILTAFLFPAEGCIDCAIDGNGRRAREGAKAGVRLESTCGLVVWPRVEGVLPARGEETTGRDMIVAVGNVSKVYEYGNACLYLPILVLGEEGRGVECWTRRGYED